MLKTAPSLPESSSSILDKNAKILGIDSVNGSELERLKLYRKTVEEIAEIMFKNRDRRGFGEKFVTTISIDLGRIIDGMRKIKRIGKAKEYIEQADVELGIALNLYDDLEEPDAEKRLRGRLNAFKNCKNLLDKAILQWPSS
ncbi:MAG: hypothetical protein HUU38_20365 [Anaerolineales bacterium]|nr:hypothetical protein [Anaerolineales bacterium]